jgi:hypothetical protein
VGYIPFNQNNQKNVVTMSYFRKQRESQEGGHSTCPIIELWEQHYTWAKTISLRLNVRNKNALYITQQTRMYTAHTNTFKPF